MKKIKSIVQLIRAKHYAVLVADSESEITWVIESLRKADEVAKNEK